MERWYDSLHKKSQGIYQKTKTNNNKNFLELLSDFSKVIGSTHKS